MAPFCHLLSLFQIQVHLSSSFQWIQFAGGRSHLDSSSEAGGGEKGTCLWSL